MGARGPKPGFKAARQAAAKAKTEGAETPLSAASVEPSAPPPAPPSGGMAALAAGAAGGPRWLLDINGGFEARGIVSRAAEWAIDQPPEKQDDEDTGFTPMEVAAPLTFAERENPERLTGEALRELAWRRGIARSTLADLSDDRIRTELRYITHRQYEEGIA